MASKGYPLFPLKIKISGTLTEIEAININQEAIKKYDFTEKSKTYYQPPIPSYLPPPPPLYHHTEPELPGYKHVYEVNFLSLLPLFLVLGTLFGLALTHLHSEPNDTVYLANYSAPLIHHQTLLLQLYQVAMTLLSWDIFIQMEHWKI